VRTTCLLHQGRVLVLDSDLTLQHHGRYPKLDHQLMVDFELLSDGTVTFSAIEDLVKGGSAPLKTHELKALTNFCKAYWQAVQKYLKGEKK
jgi:hypothetical protein